LPGSTDQYASFQKICTPTDLQQFPVDQPFPDADPAWFRMSSVTLDFRSRNEALACQQLILAQVQQLLNSLDMMDQLSDEAPIVLTATNPYEA